MLIAALFTIATIGKHPKCPPTDKKDKEVVVYINNGILLSLKRMKCYPLPQCEWTWRILCLMKYIRQRKTNIVCFYLYVKSKKIQQTGKYNKKELDSQV